LQTLGVDPINYTKGDLANEIKSKTDGKMDIFWDNVGGEILDSALERLDLLYVEDFQITQILAIS